MPTARNDGISLYYEADGDGETVAFVGDVGFGAWQWGWQHAAVAGPFESLVWDLRGTGHSDAPAGPSDVSTLAADLRAVLTDHATPRVHLVGAGLGGMVALAYARRNPVASLSLFATAPAGSVTEPDVLFAPPADRDALAATLRVALSEHFRAEQPDVVEGIAAWRAEEDATEAGWRAQAAAMRGFDAREWAVEVTTPALVVHGTADAVVPVEAGRRLAEGLPRGRFEPIDGAGHLPHVERSKVVNDLLVGFLEEHERR